MRREVVLFEHEQAMGPGPGSADQQRLPHRPRRVNDGPPTPNGREPNSIQDHRQHDPTTDGNRFDPNAHGFKWGAFSPRGFVATAPDFSRKGAAHSSRQGALIEAAT